MTTKQERNPYIWDDTIKIKTEDGKYDYEKETKEKIKVKIKVKKYERREKAK